MCSDRFLAHTVTKVVVAGDASEAHEPLLGGKRQSSLARPVDLISLLGDPGRGASSGVGLDLDGGFGRRVSSRDQVGGSQVTVCERFRSPIRLGGGTHRRDAPAVGPA